MKLFDQILEKRAQKVLKNTNGESNRTLGLETSPTFTDRVVGPSSSLNLDGAGEADCCLTVIGIATTLDSMEALDKRSGRRDGPPPMEAMPVMTPVLPIPQSPNQAAKTNS